MRSALAVLLALFIVGCGESESTREEQAMKEAVPQRLQADGTIRLSPEDRAALGLVVAPAAEGDLPDVALRFGRVRSRPEDEALVVAPFAGQVRSPLTTLGASVAAGDRLVELSPVLAAGERVSLGVQSADIVGQIQATERELETQRAEAARARDLARSEIVSTAKLQAAETAVATTQARLSALRKAQGLQVRGGEGGALTLQAPIDGTVAALETTVGAHVAQGAVLARILRVGPRWIDVDVPPNDPDGEAYEVQVGTDWQPARLLARGTVVDSSGTREDRIEVDAHSELLPGAVVLVRVARGSTRGVVLPETAVVPGVRQGTVYVETSPGVFTPRSVRIAAQLGGHLRLAKGVEPGEQVVTQGVMGLRGETARAELRHVE